MLNLEGPLFGFTGLQTSVPALEAIVTEGEKYNLLDIAGDNLVDVASDQLQVLGPHSPV